MEADWKPPRHPFANLSSASRQVPSHPLSSASHTDTSSELCQEQRSLSPTHNSTHSHGQMYPVPTNPGFRQSHGAHMSAPEKAQTWEHHSKPQVLVKEPDTPTLGADHASVCRASVCRPCRLHAHLVCTHSQPNLLPRRPHADSVYEGKGASTFLPASQIPTREVRKQSHQGEAEIGRAHV